MAIFKKKKYAVSYLRLKHFFIFKDDVRVEKRFDSLPKAKEFVKLQSRWDNKPRFRKLKR